MVWLAEAATAPCAIKNIVTASCNRFIPIPPVKMFEYKREHA
jgi:hypothetical protein